MFSKEAPSCVFHCRNSASRCSSWASCRRLRLIPQAQTLEDAKDSAGFQRLWNGKDLAGWAFLNCNKDDWGIEDGILSTRLRGTRQTAWILSEEYFADFELRLEFLLTKGADSGIAIRSAGNSPSTLGVEIQLVDDSAYPKNKPQELTGALWGIVAPAKRAAKPLGEWNQCASPSTSAS